MASWRNDLVKYQRYFFDIKALYDRRPDLRMFLEIFLSLGTIAIFAVFALRPTLITIGQLLTEIEAKQNTVDQLDKKIQNLKLAQQNYQNATASIPLLNIAVPDNATPESIVRQVEGIGKKYDLTLSGVGVGDVVIKGPVKPAKESKDLKPLPAESNGFPISFSISGDYQSLSSFLQDIQNMRRPIFIDSLSILSTKTDTGARLVLTINGRGVYEK